MLLAITNVRADRGAAGADCRRKEVKHEPHLFDLQNICEMLLVNLVADICVLGEVVFHRDYLC